MDGPLLARHLVTVKSTAFLSAALIVCYVFQGTTFTLVVGFGIVLGCLASVLSITSKAPGSFQFGMRTLLVAMTVIAVFLVWHQNRFRSQRRAVEEIRRLGGEVEFTVAGGKVFSASAPKDATVDSVSITGKPLKPADLRCLSWLTGITSLDLDYSQFGDEGLQHLARLTRLESLDLEDTRTTDNGLAHLRGFGKLDSLILDGNDITDGGLVHLKNLKSLKYLRLRNTKVTSDGLAELQKALSGCRVLGDEALTPLKSSNPFSSRVNGYPSWSAFTGMRWENDFPVVRVNEEWFELVSIHGIPVEEILQQCEQNDWSIKKRFEEDLVQIIRLMGHEIERTTDLELRGKDGDLVTMKNLLMTEANLERLQNSSRQIASKP